LGAIKQKSLNRIDKIGYGHLCLREEVMVFNATFNNIPVISLWFLREEKLSFDNNYII
jgi:hypothetical protein